MMLLRSRNWFKMIPIICMLSLLVGCTPTPPANVTSPPTTAPPTTSPPTDAPKTELRVGALRGPTAIGLLKLMADAEQGLTANDYRFTLAGAADELSAALLRGELDIIAVPVNLASILYNRTEGGVTALVLNVLGVLYVLEDGDKIHSVADLRGETLFNTGKGTTPEFVLDYILARNGIGDGEVTVEYRSEATEIAALLEQGLATLAVLPQPYVTSVLARNDKLRVALSFTEEWEKVSEGGASFVTGATIVRTGFLEQNRDAIDAFLDEYKASVAFTESNLAETAALVAEVGIIPNAALAEIAIPQCNVVFRAGLDMERDISAYLEVLFSANPQAIGGALPGEDFYYTP